jgi:hypothetical protein
MCDLFCCEKCELRLSPYVFFAVATSTVRTSCPDKILHLPMRHDIRSSCPNSYVRLDVAVLINGLIHKRQNICGAADTFVPRPRSDLSCRLFEIAYVLLTYYTCLYVRTIDPTSIVTYAQVSKVPDHSSQYSLIVGGFCTERKPSNKVRMFDILRIVTASSSLASRAIATTWLS